MIYGNILYIHGPGHLLQGAFRGCTRRKMCNKLCFCKLNCRPYYAAAFQFNDCANSKQTAVTLAEIHNEISTLVIELFNDEQ